MDLFGGVDSAEAVSAVADSAAAGAEDSQEEAVVLGAEALPEAGRG